MSRLSVFAFAGEHSGDLHGSHLIRALKERIPDISITGVAGPRMRSEGVEGPLLMEDFEVMGFSDVILAFPKLFRQFIHIRNHILTTNPQAAILIDYPGFNLRMAAALRKRGFKGKIIQYVSPTVWAWGKERIQTMANTLDLLLTIYPFEAACFQHSQLQVNYVGNPLCEYIKNYKYDEEWQTKINLPPYKKLIALFPGSRANEIKRNLPIILQAATLFLEKNPHTIFGVSCANETTEIILNQLKKKLPSSVQQALVYVPKNYTYELMRDSSSAVAKSGTVTLELALHHRPTVVIYKLTTLNRLYAQYILKLRLPHYCIVNILAGNTVFPELIESGLSVSNLFNQLVTLDTDGPQRNHCHQECAKLTNSLSSHQSSIAAAESLIKVLKC